MNFSFDELLELSQKGDNRSMDMLVGDIYGGLDYSKVNFFSYYYYFPINIHRGVKLFQINQLSFTGINKPY